MYPPMWGTRGQWMGLAGFAVIVATLVAVDPAGFMQGAWLCAWLLVLAGGYVLPAIIAYRRAHHQRMAIAALNLLLGWTGLGWVAALVWALTAVRD